MKKNVVFSLFAFLTATVMGAAAAQGVTSAPVVQDYNGVPYLTGGVGETERDAILAAANQFNLKLLFAERGGAYVADVAVSVTDPAGAKVLEVRANGPLVLANLPAGNYRIAAEMGGQRQSQNASVPATGQRSLAFYW